MNARSDRLQQASRRHSFTSPPEPSDHPTSSREPHAGVSTGCLGVSVSAPLELRRLSSPSSSTRAGADSER